jgi:hypothetical protein
VDVNIEAVLVCQELDTKTSKEVTCIFCGLLTPLPGCASKLGSHVPRHIFIVRCKLCGKEAPYRP